MEKLTSSCSCPIIKSINLFSLYVYTLENCFLQITSNSRAYLRIIYEEIKGQVSVGPLLGKQNIQVKEVYWLNILLMVKDKNYNAFKCNIKELTTKSAWVPRSAVFGMRMPGGWLHRSCDSLARSVFPSCWVLSPIFFVFLGVFLLCERFVTVVGEFANFSLFFLSVSSKVWSTYLATW